MSTWIERIHSHPIWPELNALGPSIDLATSKTDIDPSDIEGLERIRLILTFCGKRLASTNPLLLDPRQLTTISTGLTAARSEIDAYVTDSNTAHIVTANNKIDEILGTYTVLLGPDYIG